MKLRLPATRSGLHRPRGELHRGRPHRADFTGTDLTGSTIQGCTLAKANLARAIGVFFDPQKNRVKGARIGLEAAVAMVRSPGMVVEEFDRQ